MKISLITQSYWKEKRLRRHNRNFTDNTPLLDVILLKRILILEWACLPSISTTTKTEHRTDGRLILDVIVRQGAAVLQLLVGIDNALLYGASAILLIDLHLDSADSIWALTSRGILFPSNVIAEIRIVPSALGNGWRTRRRVDSLQMLWSANVLLSSSCLLAKMRHCWPLGNPSELSILVFTFSIVSKLSTSRVMLLPTSVSIT